MKSQHFPVFLCVLTVSVILPATGNAITTNWTNRFGGNFSITSNWSNGVPGGFDDAVFDVGAAYTVTFLGGVPGFPTPTYSTDQVIVDNDDVTFSRIGGTINPSFIVESITFEPTFSRGIVIGEGGGDLGYLTTTIPITAFTASIGDGFASFGQLHVTSQSTFTIAGDSFTDSVLIVGNQGSGELMIDDGAQLDVSGTHTQVSVGATPGADGQIYITGASSKLIIAAPSFNVGDRGTGSVIITAGGELDANSAFIGRNNGASGAVTVDGFGSVFKTSGAMNLGVGAGDLGAHAQGQLAVNNGGAAVIGGTLSVTTMGMLTGNSIVIAPSLVNSGIVSPGGVLGSRLGILSLDGNYTQTTAGHLQIQLNSLSSGPPNDQLRSFGAVHLGGTLDVTLMPGFTSVAGNFYDILYGSTIDGGFASINLPTLPSGLMWNASQVAITGILSIQTTGDYNGNGVVDAADYVVYRATLGQIGTGLAADGNGNGRIDVGDYDVWRSHFGKLNAPGAAAAVPEPENAWLLLIGMTAFSMLRRGQQ